MDVFKDDKEREEEKDKEPEEAEVEEDFFPSGNSSTESES